MLCPNEKRRMWLNLDGIAVKESVQAITFKGKIP